MNDHRMIKMIRISGAGISENSGQQGFRLGGWTLSLAARSGLVPKGETASALINNDPAPLWGLVLREVTCRRGIPVTH